MVKLQVIAFGVPNKQHKSFLEVLLYIVFLFLESRFSLNNGPLSLVQTVKDTTLQIFCTKCQFLLEVFAYRISAQLSSWIYFTITYLTLLCEIFHLLWIHKLLLGKSSILRQIIVKSCFINSMLDSFFQDQKELSAADVWKSSHLENMWTMQEKSFFKKKKLKNVCFCQCSKAVLLYWYMDMFIYQFFLLNSFFRIYFFYF